MNEFIKAKARKEIFELKTYVPGKPVDEVKRELGVKDVVKMASNENPLGTSPRAVAAIKEGLDSLNYYPDSNCYYLKEKMTDFWGIDAASLLIGNGSDELLRLIAETFINPDDEVILAEPFYAMYEFTAKIMGARCITVPLKDFGHDFDAMLAAVTEKTKIIYLCNPTNPTGTACGKDETDAFIKKAGQDILIVFDEAYFEYADKERCVSGVEYLKQYRNIIVLKTFSKIYGLAALRIGYALTTPEIAQAVKRVCEPFNVNTLAQLAAAAAIEDHAHVTNSLAVNNRGKDYLYAAFEEMGLNYVPTEANFIFVDTGQDSREVFNRLLQMGIIIRTGDIFGYPTFIRVTIGAYLENQRFIESLKKVLKG